jgi:hypothetical protein
MTVMHELFGGDLKKYLEIIMILSKLGFLQRVSKKEFIFKGFLGFIHTFNGKSALTSRIRPHLETRNAESKHPRRTANGRRKS